MAEGAVILFHSTNHALYAARVLKKAKLPCKMTPIPRHLSSDCGYCVQIKAADREQVKKLISEKGIEYDRIEVL